MAARDPAVLAIAAVICAQLLFTGMIRLYVEPILRPQTHWGYGLEYGSDSVFFYQTATELPECIASEGWRHCWGEQWPGGVHVQLIGAVFYLLGTSNPWPIFLLNACASGGSAFLLARILMTLGCDRTRSTVFAAVLAATPLWLFVHSELLREPYVIFAVFGALLALTKLMAREQGKGGPRRELSAGMWMVVLAVAYGVVIQFRPYLLLPLIVAFGVAVLVRAAARLLAGAESGSWRPIVRCALGVGFAFVLIAIPQRARVHTYTDRSDLTGEVSAIVNARQQRVRAARARAALRNGRLSRADALQFTAPCTVPWTVTPAIPKAVDANLQALSCNRQEFQRWCDETVLGSGADRNCDMAVLTSTAGVIAHLPASALFGLLTPYPNMWLAGFGSGGTGLRRAGYVIDGVIAYVCLAGVVPLILFRRPDWDVALSLVCALIVVTTVYGMSVPTQFIVARMRLSMYMPLLASGAYGWSLAARPLGRARISSLAPAQAKRNRE